MGFERCWAGRGPHTLADGDGAQGVGGVCDCGRTCGPVPEPFVVPMGLKHPSPAVGPAVPLGKVVAGAGGVSS